MIEPYTKDFNIGDVFELLVVAVDSYHFVLQVVPLTDTLKIQFERYFYYAVINLEKNVGKKIKDITTLCGLT